ncbi:ATP-binding protein [Chryseolinea sp. H1M3-3]|uniref:ATP-binding protein n=1 Tax=Chryseolinea sp. H1M3-3 TaxID=3034144 RepID=UPI0023EC2B27|nr:ATP-binding protein [Chryseolinea sp. H1M3-3]
MAKELFQTLKAVPEFASVPDQQIQWLVDHGTTRTYADGEKVFSHGDMIDSFQIVLEGGVTLYINQPNGRRNLGTYEPLDILGRLPYSRMKSAVAEGISEGKSILFSLHRDNFHDLICQCHDITEVLVHNMTDRVRSFTKQQLQNDKMMALGKLSAGLAHELNNPSAAVVRSAQELKKHLSSTPENFKRVIKIQANDETVDQVNDWVFSKIKSHDAIPLSLIQKTALEDELTSWLEAAGISNPYELTETLTDFAVSVDDLDRLRSLLRPQDVAPVIGWINQVLTTDKLVCDIEHASKRINTLVTSIKGYTHMDQSTEKQLADIHSGIRNTLTMLGHKLKKDSVKVVENFQVDLPRASIFISEMNQVWTNLIDNAIDAMEGISNPVLEIKTSKDREFINVSIIDNGPGIPAEIEDKIFDPFFTTKPMGKGTGLGLEVVRQIINQHNGKIELHSKPGRTEFRICFPIK